MEMETVAWAARRSMQEAAASYARSTARSVETIVVIVAAIVLAAALAGVLARACGGRHVADRDVEGWVERRCRSCLDSGLPPPATSSSKASDAK
ncbi:hypothetical protein CFC21_053537 [Triticum aestivum]|uniref:Uncharacterized protein n=3 Tax=Triticum TaxID=4564 RepID=A0A9R0SJQ1_TRITD|nr:uncharacterized protein LOC119289205 [Triticum dicoccoides]XP_044365053.1 uncharacterized protein LOC123087189 [Triticum aestivum]KAF7044288.1 hypothetical protein CFC21_053537 [Triticum aestivum]VAH95404.1 unnamed protein product [Triticum turgidum subsp. durum]